MTSKERETLIAVADVHMVDIRKILVDTIIILKLERILYNAERDVFNAEEMTEYATDVKKYNAILNAIHEL